MSRMDSMSDTNDTSAMGGMGVVSGTVNASGSYYAFDSANMGTVEVTVDSRYRDGGADLTVGVDGEMEEFHETDDADDVMAWLHGRGVQFESVRSEMFNRAVIQSVMLDRETTVLDLLGEAPGWDTARYLRNRAW